MTSCPLCGSENNSRLFSYSEYAWVRCNNCRFGYRVPYIGETELADTEINSTYAGYEENERCYMEVAKEKADWLISAMPDAEAIIEIGAGLGRVAFSLLEQRPNVDYLVIEPNDSFANRLSSKGLTVYHGKVDEQFEKVVSILEGKERILVFLDNVLEHVPFPNQMIETLLKELPRGSKLLIEVPNEKWIKHKAYLQDLLRGFRKAPTSPGHINLFTLSSMRRLISKEQLSTISVKGHPVRTLGQVRYMSQIFDLNSRIRLAVSALGLFPLDRLLGLEYWLRAEIQKL